MIDEFVNMHTEMAFRNNASTAILRAMANLGKPFNDALAAALLSLNTIHAPIQAASNVWSLFNENKDTHMHTWYTKNMVPGFGSSWFKGQEDPQVSWYLKSLPTEIVENLNSLTKQVQEYTGKPLFPNAAIVTAITADLLDMPSYMGMSLVVEARLRAWTEIYRQEYKPMGF